MIRNERRGVAYKYFPPRGASSESPRVFVVRLFSRVVFVHPHARVPRAAAASFGALP